MRITAAPAPSFISSLSEDRRNPCIESEMTTTTITNGMRLRNWLGHPG
jgi:hypothetical protein